MTVFLTRLEPYAYAMFRIVFGLLFWFHGLPKIFGVYGQTVELASLRGVAGVMELACGILIATGVLVRPAAFLASGQMAVAYFYVHQPRGVWPIENGGELAALYCFAFLFIASRGSGALSIGQWSKSATVAVLGVIYVAAFVQPVSAQQLVPKIKFGSATLDVHGWAHSIYSQETDNTTESARLRVRLTNPRGLGAYLDLDLPNLTKQNGIKRVALTYNLTPRLQVMVGRFPASVFYFAPSDIALETIQYARFPFSFYGTGAQVSYQSERGWSLLGDVTGNTTKRLYQAAQFDRVEGSVRIVLPIGKLELAPMVQVSGDFQRLAVVAAHTPSPRFRYRLTGYATREEKASAAGGHVFANFTLFPWLDQHNQVDVRKVDHKLDRIILNGFRITAKGKWLILTAEHQWRPDQTRRSNFLARIQVRY